MFKVEKNWFRDKCKEFEINSEQISVFGRYAVNADGDLLVKNDEYQFIYISAEDIASSNFDYDIDLENVICVLDDNSTRVFLDLDDLCRAFKEAVLRNKCIDSAKMGVTKDSPTRLIFSISELLRSWSDYDTEHHRTKLIPGFYEDKDYEWEYNVLTDKPKCEISLPRRYEQQKGYRFALKVININSFCNLFGWIGFSDQRTPFEMMHDLEQKVANNWNKHKTVLSSYNVDYLGDKLVIFEFSHFELDVDEPDESYRCFHACYYYVGTYKV